MGRAPKFTDDEILDRAMEALWRDGWSATSVRDLEHTLRLKAPSIYRRFGNKAGLGVAVVDHYVGRVIERRIARHLHGTGDPIANIASFLTSAVTQVDDAGRLWGCLLTTTSLEAGPGDPDLAAALQRGLGRIEEGLRGEVVRAESQGLLAPGIDADAATAVLVLAMQGLMAMSRSGAPPGDLQRRARAAVTSIARRPRR